MFKRKEKGVITSSEQEIKVNRKGKSPVLIWGKYQESVFTTTHTKGRKKKFGKKIDSDIIENKPRCSTTFFFGINK